MTFTIITPSYQQAAFLPETLASVLGQAGITLEYLVIDGGSTDGSAEIIRAHADRLAWWVSERDGGQPHAINKGLARATGDIVGFINSDDAYEPGALAAVAEVFARYPEADWVAGGVLNGASREQLGKPFTPGPTTFLQSLGRLDQRMHQPGMFWRRRLFERLGGFDEGLQFGFDHEFWCRCLAAGVEPVLIERPLAFFRRHGESKTESRRDRFEAESWEVYRRYRHRLCPAERRRVRRDLRRWQADGYAETVYARLSTAGRRAALLHSLSSAPVWPHVRPARLLLGLAWRILVSGKAPRWAEAQGGKMISHGGTEARRGGG